MEGSIFYTCDKKQKKQQNTENGIDAVYVARCTVVSYVWYKHEVVHCNSSQYKICSLLCSISNSKVPEDTFIIYYFYYYYLTHLFSAQSKDCSQALYSKKEQIVHSKTI